MPEPALERPTFPCQTCGPTTWVVGTDGFYCGTCGEAAVDSDATIECPTCHGYRPEPEPFTVHTLIGPGYRCWQCQGKGRVKKIRLTLTPAEVLALKPLQVEAAQLLAKMGASPR